MIKSKSKFIVIMVMIFTLLSVTLLSTSAKVVTSRLVLKNIARLESSTPYPNPYPKKIPDNAPIFKNRGEGKLKPTTMFKDKKTGITGYCIEYGVPATGRVDMTVHTWDNSPYWKSFSTQKQKEFIKALLYGYPKYNDPSLPDCDEYVATQCVIWEIQTGKDKRSEVLNSNSSKKAYTRLKERMAEHSRKPSFNNNTVTLKWDENSKKFKASVTDTNNELAKFSYQNVNGIKMTKSGNTLNIEADNPIPTAKTIRANKTTVPKADNTGMFVLEHKEKQNCIFGNTDDPVYSSLKVQTEPVNLVRKVSVNTGKFLSGATLELIRVSTGEVVEEWVSNSQFKVFPRLNVGERYVINERITPNGYMKAEPIVFVVSGQGANVIDVENELQPTIETEALFENGEKNIYANGEVKAIDKVNYKDFLVGKKYNIVTKVVIKDKTLEKSEVIYENTTEFTPTTANGTFETKANFDASKLKGKEVVFIQEVWKNGKMLFAHNDINNKQQTLYFPEVHTTAKDKADGDKYLKPQGKQTIIDTVAYKGLTVGKEYTIKTTLMNKRTNKPIMENGKPVVVESKFVAEKMQGTVDIEIEVDVTKLAGEKVVVFEEVYYDEHGINNTVFRSRYIFS